jgi:flagellar biosynthesis GTPase FlhF
MHSHDEGSQADREQTKVTVARKPEALTDVSRATDPRHGDPSSILQLQRLAGNASVSRLVSGEEEAPTAARSPVLDVVGQGGGSPLGSELRSEMEDRLGGDFGDVRVHRDSTASESAKAVQANAYTVGNDVVFRSDQWAPDSEAGKHTIAHELTHVMQQRAGPVAGTETGDGIRLSDPADTFERAADQNADAAMHAPATSAQPSQAAAAQASTQRQGDKAEEEEEEETAQGEFVQRQGDKAEEEEEEETAQGEFVQRQGDEQEEAEEEEEEEVAQGEFVQRQGEEEEELPEEEMA